MAINEPLRFTKSKDKYGSLWTCYPSSQSKTNVLEIWGDHQAPHDDTFILRQENACKVDLITLDVGQAYDIIRALTEALDNK